jgi:hypothetical protein
VQACADGDIGGRCGKDGTVPYLINKYLTLRKNTGIGVMWGEVKPVEKKALIERGMSEIVWNEPMNGPGVESVAGTKYDIAVWIAGTIPAAKGAQLAFSGVKAIINPGTITTGACLTGSCGDGFTRIITNNQITGNRTSPIVNLEGFRQTIINGLTFSGHAIDRMLQTGIPPSVINGVLQYSPVTGNTALEQVFYDPINNIRVVQNILTKVIVTLGYGIP